MESATEFSAALLQAAITAGLTLLSLDLFRRYRKAHFGWWTLAWALYTLRIGVIVLFLGTDDRRWLFWHQVVTGWTALALLWAAIVFSRAARWRRRYLWVVLFPFVWSYISIYRLENFLLAAAPAVAFLSVATLWTGWMFAQHRRRSASRGGALLAWTFGLWGLHHLDYPLLRAQGAWNPWGYYLDIAFLLAAGTGILLLVVEDVERGLRTLGALTGPLEDGDDLDALLARPLALPGVRGCAMYLRTEEGRRFVRGRGSCASWEGSAGDGAMQRTLDRALDGAMPAFADDWRDPERPQAPPFAFAAVLPVLRRGRADEALVIVGDARDPFTALDARFLTALGEQVGHALDTAELARGLRARTAELEFLSRRMVRQHEDERRRLSLELHDETAQVFAAVKMQLGVVQERLDPESAARVGRAVALVDEGMRGIRNVTNDLRPALLDDLGLLPALRSLVAEFGERRGVGVALEAPARLPVMADEAEAALFRALQEALSNVARHAPGAPASVRIIAADASVRLEVQDEGPGFDAAALERFEREGHLGLAGMRERISALGGTVQITADAGRGVRVAVELPVSEEE